MINIYSALLVLNYLFLTNVATFIYSLLLSPVPTFLFHSSKFQRVLTTISWGTEMDEIQRLKNFGNAGLKQVIFRQTSI